MTSPDFVRRAATSGAARRRALAERLERARDWSDERCWRLQEIAEDVYAWYHGLWRRGWRWRARALMVAPLVGIGAVVLMALYFGARLVGGAAAAVNYVAVVALAAAPILGIAWAVTAMAGGDAPASSAAARGSCDPSYPQWCIPLDQDVDCPAGTGDAPYAPASNLIVRGPDRHNLDGDHDGIGCEE
jgi:hypothetical protein